MCYFLMSNGMKLPNYSIKPPIYGETAKIGVRSYARITPTIGKQLCEKLI